MLVKEYIITKARLVSTTRSTITRMSVVRTYQRLSQGKEVLLVETSVFDVRGYHTKWYTTREYTQSEIVRPTNKTRAYKA